MKASSYIIIPPRPYHSHRHHQVKCGASLEEWESSGWMHKQDPYGWFQWYCRFYQGRRTKDDVRQVGRWSKCAGPKGRWKNNLISKCAKAGCGYDNLIMQLQVAKARALPRSMVLIAGLLESLPPGRAQLQEGGSPSLLMASERQ